MCDTHSPGADLSLSLAGLYLQVFQALLQVFVYCFKPLSRPAKHNTQHLNKESNVA